MRTRSPTQGQHHAVRGIRPVSINLRQRIPMTDSTNLGCFVTFVWNAGPSYILLPCQSQKISGSRGTQATRTGFPTLGQHHTVRGIRPVSIHQMKRIPMTGSKDLWCFSASISLLFHSYIYSKCTKCMLNTKSAHLSSHSYLPIYQNKSAIMVPISGLESFPWFWVGPYFNFYRRLHQIHI